MNKKQQYIFGAILFVFAFSFSFNEFIKVTQSEKLNSDSRNVASFDDRVSSQSEINWEHELAKSLHSQGHDGKIAERPTVMDQLVFGILQGKYNIEIVDGDVKSIRLKDSETVGIDANPEQILKEYRNIFKGVRTVRLQSSNERVREYVWEDDKGTSHSMKVLYQPAQFGSEATIQKIDF